MTLERIYRMKVLHCEHNTTHSAVLSEVWRKKIAGLFEANPLINKDAMEILKIKCNIKWSH